MAEVYKGKPVADAIMERCRMDVAKLKESVRWLSKDDWKGTNLVPILKYYEGVDARTVRVCQFNAWFNCNTIADYRAMKKYVKEVKDARN